MNIKIIVSGFSVCLNFIVSTLRQAQSDIAHPKYPPLEMSDWAKFIGILTNYRNLTLF